MKTCFFKNEKSLQASVQYIGADFAGYPAGSRSFLPSHKFFFNDFDKNTGLVNYIFKKNWPGAHDITG